MKRLFIAYRDLLGILYRESKFLVISALAATVFMGFLSPFSVWVNREIFNQGLLVATGARAFTEYLPYIVLFVASALLPILVNDLYLYQYVELRSQLILRTAQKGRMLKKLKKMRYEHLESEASMEIIDKAYNRTESSSRHMFPLYFCTTLSAIIGTAGLLYQFAVVKWWLLITIILPFLGEAYLQMKYLTNIYDELEKYWSEERRYSVLGKMLRARDFVRENRLFRASGYLIKTYKERLRTRNKKYETYYFRHLRELFFYDNLMRLSQIGNAVILLVLFLNGQMDIGTLISLTTSLLTMVYSVKGLLGCVVIFTASGYHIQFFSYYDKYFALSEEASGEETHLPEDFTIEFDNVHFAYPGTDRKVLDGLTLTIQNGEKVSIVGKNGEGKTTMIKLLLGLFEPDSGEIRIGGKPLQSYSDAVRAKLFGPVFQDFVKYSISFRENVGVGQVEKMHDEQALARATEKAKLQKTLADLPDGADTLLGRDFEGGTDLSGGQWQRVAIGRAFMGEKPVLILDEPTSQLDPMAESEIYSEFAEMAQGKTAIFITHRLGSTMITDRIYVISEGKVAQFGSHDELLASGGLYAEMFGAQKQWYTAQEGGAQHA